MNKEILQIIMAGIGTLGFSIYFRVSEKNVAASTIGGALYYTMYGIVNSNSKMLYRNGIDTVIMTVGIATGIVVGTVTINYLIKFEKNVKKN